MRVGGTRVAEHVTILPHIGTVLRSGEQVVVAAAERQAMRKIVGEIVGSLGVVVGGKVDAMQAASKTSPAAVGLETAPPPAPSALLALPLIWWAE